MQRRFKQKKEKVFVAGTLTSHTGPALQVQDVRHLSKLELTALLSDNTTLSTPRDSLTVLCSLGTQIQSNKCHLYVHMHLHCFPCVSQGTVGTSCHSDRCFTVSFCSLFITCAILMATLRCTEEYKLFGSKIFVESSGWMRP